MGETAETPVLRRMAGARRDEIALSAMTPARAMRLAVAKAGDTVLGCPVSAADVETGRLLPDGLSEALGDVALIVQLLGPDGARGIASACAQVVGAVAEARTMGKVLSSEAPARRATRTDAVLVSDFLDAMLTGFGALSAGCTPPPPVGGFSYLRPLADARAATLVLADAAHLMVRVRLDLGAGAKTGTMIFVFPAEPARVGQATGAAAGPDWSGRLKATVMAAPARLEAILCRLKLPLADVRSLQVGQVLTLTAATLDGLTLVATDGRRLQTARLGRLGAFRAVRLDVKPGTRPAGKPGKPPPAEAANAVPGLPAEGSEMPAPMAATGLE